VEYSWFGGNVLCLRSHRICTGFVRKRWEKRAVKKEIDKMMKDIHNADEYDIPVSKKDADYHWF
jgi:hypothetical protein